MIIYNNRAYGKIFVRCTGSSVFSKPVVLPTIFSSALCVVAFQFPHELALGESLEWPAWVFSTGLAFAIIFRAALAYRRFWGGISASVAMLSLWRSSATNLLGFADASIKQHELMGNTAICAELTRSKKLLGHWFSMLFAVAVQTLQWREEAQDLRPMTEAEARREKQRSFWSPISEEEIYDQVYIRFPSTAEERSRLGASFDKLSQIIIWIENEIARLHLFQRLLISAPILSRVFEDLSNGALAYCEAHMIAFIPFPFLFAQVLNWLLIIFVVVCPFIVQAATSENEGGLIQEPLGWSWPSVVIMNGMLVAGFSGLNEIATVLEDPFRENLNNFPIRAVQRRVDTSLASINRDECHDEPSDFGLCSFGPPFTDLAAKADQDTIASALSNRHGVSAGPPSVKPVVDVCEELRASLCRTAPEMSRYTELMLKELRVMEHESCKLAYRAILSQSSTVSKNALGVVAEPSFGGELTPAATPNDSSPRTPRTPRSTDAKELRLLLEQADEVNRRLGPMLIHSAHFGSGEVRTDWSRAGAM